MPLPKAGASTIVKTYMYTSVALPGKSKEGLIRDFLTCFPEEALAREGETRKCRIGVVKERYQHFKTENEFHFHLVFQSKDPVRWARWTKKLKKMGYPGHTNYFPGRTDDGNWAAATKYLTEPAKDKEIDVEGMFGYERSGDSIVRERWRTAMRKSCCAASLGHYLNGSPLMHSLSCPTLGLKYPYVR